MLRIADSLCTGSGWTDAFCGEMIVA